MSFGLKITLLRSKCVRCETQASFTLRARCPANSGSSKILRVNNFFHYYQYCYSDTGE